MEYKERDLKHKYLDIVKHGSYSSVVAICIIYRKNGLWSSLLEENKTFMLYDIESSSNFLQALKNRMANKSVDYNTVLAMNKTFTIRDEEDLYGALIYHASTSNQSEKSSVMEIYLAKVIIGYYFDYFLYLILAIMGFAWLFFYYVT